MTIICMFATGAFIAVIVLLFCKLKDCRKQLEVEKSTPDSFW